MTAVAHPEHGTVALPVSTRWVAGLIAMVALLLPCVSPASLVAQERSIRGGWFGLGVGVADAARSRDFIEIAFLLEAAYWTGSNVVTLRRSGVTQLTTPVLADIGLLYGRRIRTETGVHVAFAAGLAYVSDLYNHAVGFPWEVGVTVPSDRFGPGLRLFSNLSSLGSFTGLSLTIQVGRLR